MGRKGFKSTKRSLSIQAPFKCLFVSMFTNVQLVKANHMDSPHSKGREIELLCPEGFSTSFYKGITMHRCYITKLWMQEGKNL